MSETRRRTVARFERENPKNRPFIQIPLGNATIAYFLDYLADYLAGNYEDKPDPRPRFMVKRDAHVLAAATLAPMLDAVLNPRWGDDDLNTAELKLCTAIGYELGVTPKRRFQAGDWLFQHAMDLDIFVYDEDGFPRISDKWQPDIARIRVSLIEAKPSYAPFPKKPPPWREWQKTYDDGFRAKFCRDWRPETKSALNVAFINPDFEHAAAVNKLAAVPLRLDPFMVDLVAKVGAFVVGKDGAKRIADDVTVAGWCGDRAVWLDYSCDKRGRIYALQHLNFAREDHVRALFKFANGMKLDFRLVDGMKVYDTHWLEIHCANCEGTTERKSEALRIKWVGDNKQLIKDVARDPIGTLGKWIDVRGKPFAFVAACRELAAAWEDPENFVTRLPIGFDGTANGLQHLCALSSDYVAAGKVNLLPDVEDPSDIYELVGKKAIARIAIGKCEYARWWSDRFTQMDATQAGKKLKRRLLKQPVMTFAYSVKLFGAALQIAEAYEGPRPPGGVFIYKKDKKKKVRLPSGVYVPKKIKLPGPAFTYLAKMVLKACAEELKGPNNAMKYICKLADHCTDQNGFMRWISPSGFPCENRYQEPNITRVNVKHGEVRVRRNIADGVTDEIRRKKAKNSAAPNFVHSLDAAHLAKTVNASVREGITDILTIHDSYSCLAPQATRFKQIIHDQLAEMYEGRCLLDDLRARNVTDDSLPVPVMGTLFFQLRGEYVDVYLKFAPKFMRLANAFR